MKQMIKLIGIIAITAVIGFMFTACEPEPGGSGGGGGGGGGDITLSGTISISLNDTSEYEDGIIPVVQIIAHDESWTFQRKIVLLEPEEGRQWSINIPRSNTARNVYYRITGYRDEDDEAIDKMFEIGSGEITLAGSSNISGIELDLGNLTFVTVSGTIVMEVTPRKEVVIELIAANNLFLGSKILQDINNETPKNFEITVRSFTNDTDIERIVVMGYPQKAYEAPSGQSYYNRVNRDDFDQIGIDKNQAKVGSSNVTGMNIGIYKQNELVINGIPNAILPNEENIANVYLFDAGTTVTSFYGAGAEIHKWVNSENVTPNGGTKTITVPLLYWVPVGEGSWHGYPFTKRGDTYDVYIWVSGNDKLYKAENVIIDSQKTTIAWNEFEEIDPPLVDYNPEYSLITTGTSNQTVKINGDDYVFLYNNIGSSALSGQTPNGINGFAPGNTPRILYIFWGNWESYNKVIITYEMIGTSLGSCGEDGCADAAPLCPSVIVRTNNSQYEYEITQSNENPNDLGYPNLEEGINTLTYNTSDFTGKYGFSITKNHGNSAVLVRIISVAFTN